HRCLSPRRIINAEANAVAVPEIELGEITVQMAVATMLINSAHAAFEDREEALNGVGARLAAHPFAASMHDVIVPSELATDTAIELRLVGIQDAVTLEVLANDAADVALVHPVRMDGTGAPAALDESDDHALVGA